MARGTGIARGAKGTLAGGVAGVAGFYGHRVASENLSMVRSNWWIAPAMLAVVGHFVKRRQRFATIGAALTGAAGYAGAMGFTMNQQIKAQQPDTQGVANRALELTRLQRSVPELPDPEESPAADTSAVMSLGRRRYAA